MTTEGSRAGNERAATSDRDALRQAQARHAQVQRAWMAIPGVRGVHVGLLRDEAGAPRPNTVGLVVTAAATEVPKVAERLPRDLEGTPVHVIAGEPKPQTRP